MGDEDLLTWKRENICVGVIETFMGILLAGLGYLCTTLSDEWRHLVIMYAVIVVPWIMLSVIRFVGAAKEKISLLKATLFLVPIIYVYTINSFIACAVLSFKYGDFHIYYTLLGYSSVVLGALLIYCGYRAIVVSRSLISLINSPRSDQQTSGISIPQSDAD